MKIINALSLVVAVSTMAFSEIAASQEPVNLRSPFTLEITGNRTNDPSDCVFANSTEITAKSGSAVQICIRKTNISDREIIKKTDAGGAWGYAYDVRDSGGNPVGPNKSHQWNGRGGGPAPVRGTKDMVLQPQEATLVSVLLSDWFDLSQPGTYTVQVSGRTSNDPASALVTSNKITLTVIQADDRPPQQ